MKRLGTFTDRLYALAVTIAVAALVLLLAIVESMGADGRQPAGPPAPWLDDVRAVDEALAVRNPRAARGALERAYTAALGSRRWEAMLDVGQAARRAGDLPGARRAWLAALIRARQAGAVDGVLGVAEAFASIGDRAVAQGCLTLARELAGRVGDERAFSHMSSVVEGLAERGPAIRIEP